MKYEIVYFSKNGSTKKLAQSLTKYFPAGQCRLVDIAAEEPDQDAEVYLVGFGVQRGACPYLVLDWLENLKGKKVLLFATGGLAAFPEYHKKLETLVTSFLPDECEYLGFHLCQGRISQEGYAYLESCLSNPNDSSSAQTLKQLYAHSQNHPDASDIEKTWAFVRDHL